LEFLEKAEKEAKDRSVARHVQRVGRDILLCGCKGIPFHYTTLHCIAFNYTPLHYTTSRYITLHYITLHCIHRCCIYAYTYVIFGHISHNMICQSCFGQTLLDTGNCEMKHSITHPPKKDVEKCCKRMLPIIFRCPNFLCLFWGCL
jgi:hypothetical protein